MLRAIRTVVAIALMGIVAATGCTSHSKIEPPASSATTLRGADDTSRLSGPSWDRARADWLKANGYPAWLLSAPAFEQHFRTLCQRIANAYDDGPPSTRTKLARQYNADAKTAGEAGFGPMEFMASRVPDQIGLDWLDCDSIGG